MRPLRPIRRPTLLIPLLILAIAPFPASAQVIGGHSLQGDWVRVDSNNDPADRMRITINSTAVLTSVPARVASSWQPGQVLWQGIQSNGSLQVRGSDGQYYAATLTFNGPDEIHLDISKRTPGFDQTWRRPGPDISGDWVRVGPPGTPGAGTMIRVQGADASVRYLPAAAPRVLRVGSRLWQTIGASGGLQTLGSDNKYHTATWSLLAPDRIQVDATQLAGGAGQLWVRPNAVAAAQASLPTTPANPNTPGANLTPPANPPGSSIPGPLTTPPASTACLATSLPHDQMGLDWGLRMFTLSNNDALLETLGVREYRSSRFGSSGAGRAVPIEIERLRLNNVQPGYVYLWDWRGSSRRNNTWRLQTDLTATLLDQAIQQEQATGNRPSDLEAHGASSGVVYGAIWEQNPEGLNWLVRYDLDAQAFASTNQNLRNSGYRLVDLEVAQSSGAPRFVGLWYMSCDNTNWKTDRDLDRTAYQARVNAEAAQGYQVIDFESYHTPAGQRYAAIWQRATPGRAWAVHSDRTLEWFLNYHNDYVDQGMRLIDFESYATSNGLRYAGVWAENDDRYDYPFRADLDKAIEDYRTQNVIPGISVVVMLADEVIYRRGFGWADEAGEKQAHSGTVYLTASIAKAIAGTLTARLAERGHLNLDDATTDHVPNLASQSPTHTHTIEELLSKTGCVRHYREVTSAGAVDLTQTYAWRVEVIKQLRNDPILPNCTPGSDYRYSTHGFTYLGAVLEAVMGEPIADIITNELTLPLQLYSMRTVMTEDFGGYGGLGVEPYNLTQGYLRDPNNWQQYVETDFENSTWKVLGGGLQTNTLDLARFGWLTMNGTAVSMQMRDNELWRVRTTGLTNWLTGNPAPPTALGWEVWNRGPVRTNALGQPMLDANGRPVLRFAAEHQGNALTVTSFLRVYRDDQLTIAILNNQREDLSQPRPPNTNWFDHQVRQLTTDIATAVFANPPPP